MKKLVRDLLKQRHNKLELSILNAFGFCLTKRQPNFNCGLFKYDWKLVFAIIAAASSKFVILIQFDVAQKMEGQR